MSKERSYRQFEVIFKTKTTLTKQKAVSLANILKGLLNNPLSEEFREPLDWEERGLINYDVIIQEPMDLRTVKETLKKEMYSSIEECLNDIELIFQNSRHYNRGTTWIEDLTEKCEKAFLKLVKNYLPQIRASFDSEKKAIKSKKIKQKHSHLNGQTLHSINNSGENEIEDPTKVQQPNEETAPIMSANHHSVQASENENLLKLRTQFFDLIKESSQSSLQIAYLIIKGEDLSVINTQRNGNCKIDVKQIPESIIVKLIQFLNEQKQREAYEMRKVTIAKKKRDCFNEKSRYQI